MEVNNLDYAAIGARVRAARVQKGLQQADLAYKIGITNSHMSHIETGQTKPALPTLIKLANELAVSVDELLCDNLDYVQHVYDSKIAEELADCSSSELRAVLDIIRVTKSAIRKACQTVLNADY